jgi:DMSO/TMAO reductase YedYZ heme-binding membrane subunit
VSLLHHFGGDPVRYFFTMSSPALGSIRGGGFGVSVWIGAVAAALLAGLGAISNDVSLRTLGSRWKILQRSNYALIALVLVHTWLFWKVLDRAQVTRTVTVAACAAVLVLQLLGAALTVRRTRA